MANQQAAGVSAYSYPIALLPVKTRNDDRLNQVKLKFILSNQGTIAIKTFEGLLMMQDARLSKAKRFNVPLTQFKPAIEPEQSGTVIIESSIEDINVMRAIKNAQDVTIKIDEDVLSLMDGKVITFGSEYH